MLNKKAITLIELLATIVIIGVVATIAVITIGNIVSNSRVKADIENVNALNQATYYYSLMEDDDLFLNLETNEERIQFLVVEDYLNKYITPAVSDAEFMWDEEAGYWIYTVYDQALEEITEIDFDSFNVDDFEYSGDWETLEGKLISDYGLLFIDNPRLEYTITVSAIIEEGSYGGFGILFDTAVIDGEDTGYILQFDRGYGRGAILIRPRESGNEGNVIQAYKFNYYNSFIPDKNTVDGEIWWNSEHEVELSVIVTEGVTYTKILSVKIDDQLLFDDFEYETNVGSTINFTGLRTWSGVEVEFISFLIE